MFPAVKQVKFFSGNLCFLREKNYVHLAHFCGAGINHLGCPSTHITRFHCNEFNCDVTYIANKTDTAHVINMTNIANITQIANITHIAQITNIANITHIAHILNKANI